MIITLGHHNVIYISPSWPSNTDLIINNKTYDQSAKYFR